MALGKSQWCDGGLEHGGIERLMCLKDLHVCQCGFSRVGLLEA